MSEFNHEQHEYHINFQSQNPNYYQPNPSNLPPVYSPPPEKRKKKIDRTPIIAAILSFCIIASGAAGLGGAFLGNYLMQKQDLGTKDRGATHTPVFYKSVNIDTTTPMSDIATVAASVAASIVEIRTETVKTGGYFQQYISGGAGSGVVLSADGYIVTNHHVINGADTITVRTNDDKEYTATVIGTDSETDVAVIKIDASDLSPVLIGDSTKLVVGQDVVAIGNPLGELGGTVTNGIISALDREITIDGDTMTLLQTNAAINPGNSGGGLFNLYGELVGIVNAKSSGTDIEGLGFAIPINMVYSVVEQILEYGYVKGRPFLGIETIYISDYSQAACLRSKYPRFYMLLSSSFNRRAEARRPHNSYRRC